MPAFSKDAIVALFPEEDPPALEGKPTYATLKPLNRVLLANARSIPCLQGGNRGHQGMIQDPAIYNALPGAAAWVDPVNPPAQPVWGGANQAGREALLENHRRQRDEYQTAIFTDNALKAIILRVVPDVYTCELKDDDFGYSETTTRELLAHLNDTYGQVKPKDLEANRTALFMVWDPSTPIEKVWSNIQSRRAFQRKHSTGGVDFAADVLIERTIATLQESGAMRDDIRRWNLLPQADRATFVQLKAHFNEAYENYLKNVTTEQAGYHAANAATTRSSSPTGSNGSNGSSLEERVENLSAQLGQVLAAVGSTRNNNQTQQQQATGRPAIRNDAGELKELFYCWSCGYSLNPGHTSPTCRSKKENHQDEATATNRMGGSKNIKLRGINNNNRE